MEEEKIMKRTVLFVLLCLGLLASVPSAEGKNLVRKRPYSYYPKPNYSH